MTLSLRKTEQTPRAEGPDPPPVELPYFEWPEFLKVISELADPMQSEIVKGWLASELRGPT